MSARTVRNRWTFAVGTVGRDMAYALVTMYLVYFLTEPAGFSDGAMGWITAIMLGSRLVDAVLDVVMGGVVDNTRTRWGPYKPWVVIGTIVTAVLTVLLFAHFDWPEAASVAMFGLIYVLWGVAWTTNDIPYWSILPALSFDPAERERIGALAKIFATIGLATTVIAVLPVTSALTPRFGATGAWTVFATILVVIMLAGVAVTVAGVRVPPVTVEQPRTSFRELGSVVLRNDQLLVVAVSQILFMLGYVSTTTFGTYFFKYVVRDESLYTVFAGVLLGSQLVGLLAFPAVARRLSRRRLYTLAVGIIVVGYVAFFFSPTHIAAIGACGLLLFIGQSWVSMLMLMFISDAIDYGHLKLGRRNQAVTFALQPFINKVGGALAAAFVTVTVVVSGINAAPTPDDVTPSGLLMLRLGMLVVPCLLIVAGFVIWRARYTLDEQAYAAVLAELRERGQIS